MSGSSQDRLRWTHALIAAAVGRGDSPGAVLLAGRRGGREVGPLAWGDAAVLPDRRPMTPETIFDLASLTKVVATTMACWAAVERGLVRLDDEVRAFLPDFPGAGVPVRHPLSPTSGLPAWRDRRPREAVPCSDLGFIILGAVLAAASGMPLDRLADETVFQPLGTRQTRCLPPEAWRSGIAPTEWCADLGGQAQGVVHDENARALGGVPGLFAPAADLGLLCAALLRGGGPARSAATVSAMTVNGSGALGQDRTSGSQARTRRTVGRRRDGPERLRSHRLHRHEPLDRPGSRPLLRPADEPGAPRPRAHRGRDRPPAAPRPQRDRGRPGALSDPGSPSRARTEGGIARRGRVPPGPAALAMPTGDAAPVPRSGSQPPSPAGPPGHDSGPARRRSVLRARVVLLRGRPGAEEVLLAWHRHPEAAFWCFPGGGVEPGESAGGAALREATEETGLVVRLEGLCFVLDRPEADALDLFYLARGPDGGEALGSDPERAPGEPPVLADLRWVPVGDLARYAVRPAELAAALADGRFWAWGRLPSGGPAAT